MKIPSQLPDNCLKNGCSEECTFFYLSHFEISLNRYSLLGGIARYVFSTVSDKTKELRSYSGLHSTHLCSRGISKVFYINTLICEKKPV